MPGNRPKKQPSNERSVAVPASWRNRIVGYGVKPASEFLANPANWRLHPDAQQQALAGTIGELGVVAPVIENTRTGHVLDGHLRITLALRRGEQTEVPYIQVDLDEAEERLALATLDPIGAMAAPDAGKLDELLHEVQSGEAAVQAMLADLAKQAGLEYGQPVAEAPEAQIDKAAELQAKWQTATGQLWLIPSKSVAGKAHRLLCGDSTKTEDVARLMSGEQAEMVWTDPPYGVSVGDKNKFLNTIAPCNRVEENLTNDTLDESSLMMMFCRAADCAIVHCHAGAAWYVAAPARPLHVLFGQALKDRGIWRQTIQWVKNNATFAPMGVDYHWRAEPIFYGWLPNGGHRYYGGRQQDTVWEIDRPTKSPEHPTMKPVELVSRAISNSSRVTEIVYDAFLGSGTTAIAAEQTGRLCYSMEIEPKYVAVALERLVGLGLTPRRADD